MSEQELKKLEDKLWAAADKMRGAVSVSDYKFIVLGLIFLKYISDSFEEKYKELLEEGAGLEEERDCYTAENIFYVPKNARWEYLVEHSKDANIGEIIDDALTLIEKENIVGHVQEIGDYLAEKLDELVKQNEFCLSRKGTGLMQGIQITKTPGEIANAALKEGLLVIGAGTDVIRFVPPLIIEKEHVDKMISVLKRILK